MLRLFVLLIILGLGGNAWGMKDKDFCDFLDEQNELAIQLCKEWAQRLESQNYKWNDFSSDAQSIFIRHGRTQEYFEQHLNDLDKKVYDVSKIIKRILHCGWSSDYIASIDKNGKVDIKEDVEYIKFESSTIEIKDDMSFNYYTWDDFTCNTKEIFNDNRVSKEIFEEQYSKIPKSTSRSIVIQKILGDASNEYVIYNKSWLGKGLIRLGKKSDLITFNDNLRHQKKENITDTEPRPEKCNNSPRVNRLGEYPLGEYPLIDGNRDSLIKKNSDDSDENSNDYTCSILNCDPNNKMGDGIVLEHSNEKKQDTTPEKKDHYYGKHNTGKMELQPLQNVCRDSTVLVNNHSVSKEHYEIDKSILQFATIELEFSKDSVFTKKYNYPLVNRLDKDIEKAYELKYLIQKAHDTL